MPRRALRPSFVVTFALGAAAIAGGCGTSSSNPPPPSSDVGGDSSVGDSSIGDDSPIGEGGCPAEQPANGTPCDLPSSVTCSYPDGFCLGSPVSYTMQCSRGIWEGSASAGSCNPPSPQSEAGPDAYDDAASDVSDGGPDGEGQDGGHLADATGDVAPGAETE